MNEADFGHSDTDAEFGREPSASARETLAPERSEIEPPHRVCETLPATRVKEIRRKVAKSPKASGRTWG